jgi:hypothetical protein
VESGELEGEFAIRMGVTESEVRSILDTWPEVEDVAEGSRAVIAINNALNSRALRADEQRGGRGRASIESAARG